MIVSRAPFRISLGGGGTDLPSYYHGFGGFVLSAAINKYLYVCVNRPAADDLIRLKYSRYEQVEKVDDIEHDLVRPALRLLDIGQGIEIASMADVPAGTGLGSSGTYLVALLTALHELKRDKVQTQALAEQACHIEMNLAQHPVGKHDHYLAAFGGITCLEISPAGDVAVSALAISLDTIEQLRARLMLFYTGVTRNANDILASQVRDTSRGDAAVIESLHHTKALGYKVRDALIQGDLDQFGHLLHEHWETKKRRSGAISDVRVDRCYDAARKAGALGGKIVGAGGGGFLMVYCSPSQRHAVRQSLLKEGLREMPFDFDFEGAKVMVNFLPGPVQGRPPYSHSITEQML